MASSQKSLKSALNNFNKDKVEIKKDDMTAATIVMEELKKDIFRYLKGLGVPMRPFELMGSVYEGLKVIFANEFDLLMPLDLSDCEWDLENFNEVATKAGYWRLKLGRNKHAAEVPVSKNEWCKSLSKYLDNGYLSAVKIRRAFQSFLQKWSDQYKKSAAPKYEINVRQGGPAVTLNVVYGSDRRELCIDFVPAIDLRPIGMPTNALVVAKPPPKVLRGADVESLWLQSYCREEKERMNKIDQADNGCRKKCVKILKTIRLHNSQMGVLSSYVFKSILLKVCKDRKAEHWGSDSLADRFIDLLKELHSCLKTKNLPSQFNSKVNILASLEDPAIRNIETYLAKVIHKESYVNDLLTCSGTCKYCKGPSAKK
ncbi:unnamed protein product [Owenia fusiformis]|uniref:Uncharacterized protein n=1 Tax=Owenia fusiformis TaxID=6347 RepID=A0A8J1UG21_OWEFU|nr:unnamed protein product [Owenia fusiformis]